MGRTVAFRLESWETAVGERVDAYPRIPQAAEAAFAGPPSQRGCLMRAVSSCTRLYTDRSSRMSLVILSLAWMTVV
jgi:hypothetical protein